MKQCGYKEECFENGESQWGRLGSILCAHLTEEELNRQAYCICGKTKQLVHFYNKDGEKLDLI